MPHPFGYDSPVSANNVEIGIGVLFQRCSSRTTQGSGFFHSMMKLQLRGPFLVGRAGESKDSALPLVQRQPRTVCHPHWREAQVFNLFSKGHHGNKHHPLLF